MCIILDADCFGDYLNKEPDFEPIHKWLSSKSGKIVYSDTGRFKKEYKKSKRMWEQLQKWRHGEKIILIDANKVTSKEERLRSQEQMQSNDVHIIALAMTCKNVRVLVSKDRALGNDFKTFIGGSIYKKKSHKRLLRRDTCP